MKSLENLWQVISFLIFTLCTYMVNIFKRTFNIFLNWWKFVSYYFFVVTRMYNLKIRLQLFFWICIVGFQLFLDLLTAFFFVISDAFFLLAEVSFFDFFLEMNYTIEERVEIIFIFAAENHCFRIASVVLNESYLGKNVRPRFSSQVWRNWIYCQ